MPEVTVPVVELGEGRHVLMLRIRLGSATVEDLVELYSAIDTAYRAAGGSPLTFRAEQRRELDA